MGDFMLVAPMFTGETSRKVILPAGKWYDFYNGKYVGENEIISVEPGLDKIPLFVKDGGIIPMTQPRRQAPKSGQKIDLEIRHYGSASGSYDLYDDDGESFNFEKGDYSRTTIKVSRDKKGRLAGSISRPEKGKPYGYNKEVKWVFMTVDAK